MTGGRRVVECLKKKDEVRLEFIFLRFFVCLFIAMKYHV